jgi:hypothetical protein
MSLSLADIRMRDPFVLALPTGGWALFGTTDAHVWGGPATGFDVSTSDDLQRWQGPMPAFRPPPGFWADTQFWAPEVFAHQGRFVMVATFASSRPQAGPRGIQVLVADAPTGPYVPWSDGPITPRDWPCLDGTLFWDEQGAPWLVYSRGAEGRPGGPPGLADGQMLAQRLAHDLRRAAGEPQLLFAASSAPWAQPMRLPPGVSPPEHLNLSKNPLFTDGPFIVRSPSGALLMLWSSFGEQGYAMGVATSRSGRITGPWVQQARPLWARNGGHGMLLADAQGQWQLVFHAPNDTPNERVQCVPVVMGDDNIRLVNEG